MKSLCLIFSLVLTAPVNAQLNRQNVAAILGFENGQPGQAPAGWSCSPGAVFIDNQVVHGGKNSALVERGQSTAGTFSTCAAGIPIDFTGRTITWRGWLKTENVSSYAAIYVREDAGTMPSVAFATTQGLGVNGTTDWKQYTATVPVVNNATTLVVGFLMGGTGKAWYDDFDLLVDGVPIAQAPNASPSVFATDHEFDNGSKINISSLSETQRSNLATLGKVWGFVKYHHPAVSSGKHHWDYELFRILPKVLQSPDAAGANQAMAAWITAFERVNTCTTCAQIDQNDLVLGTNVDWISDTSLLGPDLSEILQNIYQNRTIQSKQIFVSLQPAGNPQFDNEFTYNSIKFPDSGFQLLALFRFWNMVQYFYPNREIMSNDPANQPDYWDSVLTEFIPRVALAQNSFTYQQEMMRFITRMNDTHANLWSSIAVRPPTGTCQLPVWLRFVEGKPLIMGYNSTTAGPNSGLMPGDIIEQLDGIPVTDLVAQWTPYYADSNPAARARDMAVYFTRGTCGPAEIEVRRGDDTFYLITNRVLSTTLDVSAGSTHDLSGDAFQLLSDDVAYVKISTLKSADAADDIRKAAGTKGLIIDMRNYPSDYLIFSLGQLLVSERRDFVRFTQADVTNPGVFHWTPPITLFPQQPHYSGKVVILVDEITQSSAEYHAMAFRSAPGAIVIGGTTAGADGNVSTVPLPGNLSSYISGIGVFYPDNSPTQRIGIIPDIVLTPTIEGLRAGRDELLEEAIRQITGH